MPDQASYLFDNQYHPEVIEKAYAKIRATTWDHCVHTQTVLAQHYLYGGHLREFTKDLVRNKSLGFPEDAYACFIPEKILQGKQKYILEHFVKKKELMSLFEILKDPNWAHMYIFHMAEYIFMALKVRVTNEGTWLVLPIDRTGTDGVTEEWLNWAQSDYNEEYSDNRWFLERRPKVSYGYTEGTFFTLVRDSNRVYLDNFQEMRYFYAPKEVKDWKLCVSDRSDNLKLMRANTCYLHQDEESGRYYIELSENFIQYIEDSGFRLHVFLYNEANQAGYAIAPNYIGPSGYLLTVFDEYIATCENQRLKIMCQDINGGWTTVTGKDDKFGNIDDLIVVGYTQTDCWIAIPTKPGVSPITPRAFRIWEYDAENDLLGRMVSFDMAAAFPNIYLYRMKSESSMVYIEWFREDEQVKSDYDDFLYGYRNYIGPQYYENAQDNTLPACIENFKPYVCKFDVSDMVKHLLLESAHDYRVHEMINLLKETGLHYSTLYDMLDKANARYRTHTFKMAESPEFYETIKKNKGLRIASSSTRIMPYDLYIDGEHISETYPYWESFNQYITLPVEKVKANSVIVVDFYENVEQFDTELLYSPELGNAVLPAQFPLETVCGSDLVLSDIDGNRIPLRDIHYGIFGQEFICQVPFGLIDFEKLGISPDDPRIQERVGVSPDGTFKALTWSVILPLDLSYVHLLSVNEEQVSTNEEEHLVVHAGQLFQPTKNKLLVTYDAVSTDENGVTSPNVFTKRVNSNDLNILIDNIKSAMHIKVWNANVQRVARNIHLGDTNQLELPLFSGVDDPNRFIVFVNGILQDPSVMTAAIPATMNTDMVITLSGVYGHNDVGEVIYLPFPVERHTFHTDEHGWANLAGTGIHCIGKNDIIFVNGKRLPYEEVQCITNQMVYIPAGNAECVIIRVARDSNLFEFEDTTSQCFFDELYAQSPGYLEAVKSTFPEPTSVRRTGLRAKAINMG